MNHRARNRCYYVYILSSLSGTLYVGMTDNLRNRVVDHKLELVDGFTKKYSVTRLMYFEIFRDSSSAEAREQQIKNYRREKKIALFAKSNPHWKDRSEEVLGIKRRSDGSLRITPIHPGT